MIVEAMAAGACLVVSDHAPNVEVVDDTAATFPLTGRAAVLAATLRGLIDDPNRRARLAAEAITRAGNHFSWDACAQAYLQLCSQVAHRG